MSIVYISNWGAPEAPGLQDLSIAPGFHYYSRLSPVLLRIGTDYWLLMIDYRFSTLSGGSRHVAQWPRPRGPVVPPTEGGVPADQLQWFWCFVSTQTSSWPSRTAVLTVRSPAGSDRLGSVTRFFLVSGSFAGLFWVFRAERWWVHLNPNAGLFVSQLLSF